ncbi:MAG: tRNA (adenosine(37)-N6)-threonylcarbamoyltransferase complex ATPase subunit type 1 TsaE [Phycisphaerales bacterium]
MTADGLSLTSDSLERTSAIGAAIGRCLRPGHVIRLYGELGAGKTAFVRALARGIGLDTGLVNSPTYTIANEYRGEHAMLLHIDAYRIDDADETLDQIGLWDAIEGGAIVCIEWPERLGDAIMGADLDVTIAHAGPDTREITLTGRLVGEHAEVWQRSLENQGDER